MTAINEKLSFIPIERGGTPRGYVGVLPEITEDVLRATGELYRTGGFQEPWICYLALMDDKVVGTCGFKSPPCDKRVEIAYFTFPEFERRGIASAMAARLLAIARQRDPSILVTAQTLSERNASHRVLEKLGFHYVKTIHHPEDGVIWEWELR